ncbi:MAG: Smr/MutS family protein, partial [Vallitaleaceae bacterium]|nr:Smr/MutS family protein [Vallitaleaceae bacterium]
NQLDARKLTVGDKVFVNTLGQNGTVVSVSANKKEALIQMGIMKTTVPISALELSQDDVHFEGQSLRKPTGKKYTQAKGNKSTSGYTISKSSSVKPELDLRGTTLSEALEMVDKYLDDAFLSHLPQVTLIHGKGTGALRQGIHQFLRTAPNVDQYRLGNYGEGESGVTIVVFKE